MKKKCPNFSFWGRGRGRGRMLGNAERKRPCVGYMPDLTQYAITVVRPGDSRLAFGTFLITRGFDRVSVDPLKQATRAN